VANAVDTDVVRGRLDLIATGNLTATSTGNILLSPTGNIVLANTTSYINNVKNPVQAQDAATKSYVDSAYTAGSGLKLTGNSFTPNTDGITTSVISGNIVVPPGAILTTPNIGAATGISLLVTGNVTGGNLATGNITIDSDSISISNKNLDITASAGNTITIVNGNNSEVDILTNGVEIKTSSNAVTYTWNYSNTGNTTFPANGAITATGNITTTGNISGNYILGNGSQLTGIITSVSNIVNGSSNISIDVPNGVATVGINGVANAVILGQGVVTAMAALSTQKTITANSVITDNTNSITISPSIIANGVSVTVPDSSTWYIFTPS
jgi:hypothetical protein